MSWDATAEIRWQFALQQLMPRSNGYHPIGRSRATTATCDTCGNQWEAPSNAQLRRELEAMGWQAFNWRATDGDLHLCETACPACVTAALRRQRERLAQRLQRAGNG